MIGIAFALTLTLTNRDESGLLYFSYGDGINLPLFFEVFSFEVCTNPLTLVSTSGRKEFNFFKSPAMDAQDRLYLLEILTVVGSYSDSSAGN